METVIIERKAFEELSQQVDILTAKIDRFCRLHENRSLSGWIDNEYVCRLLHICPRTLQHYRDTGTIPFVCISRKFYYKRKDIHRFLSASGNEIQYHNENRHYDNKNDVDRM